ncbi:cell death regulator Aven isoform X2 [Lepisosteus oculatus]|uniref:cell death regulator Aven isoform X2 n=1 Tax=Lepisosteus oculatus TaxID=7918 RepID=UPI000740453B|nr:PREDICTED: cell death regulator Aven isoform X2 [Lepisosteus oculatus]
MEQRSRHRGGGGWRRGGHSGGGSESGTGTPTEHRGRGRGGPHRGRGRRDHHRGRGRSGPPRCDRAEDEVDNKEDHEEDGPDIFSRRKLESNWDRYEAAEKEELCEGNQTKRGEDFHVLLSSAGDSFTQFRFSEEKEWEVDALANNQMSAFFVDSQLLAQSLQALPLHVRLNVEAELVQVSAPAELPVIIMKNKQDFSLTGQFGVPTAIKPAPTCASSANTPVPLSESVDGKPLRAIAPQMSVSAAQPPADDLDEELDLLLSLDPHVPAAIDSVPSQTNDLNKDEMKAPSPVITSDGVKEEQERSPEATVLKKEITEDDLEDWLDSMIS